MALRTTPLNVAQIAGTGICVSLEDGNRVHERIFSQLQAGNRVVLSFFGVTRMTTAFLNAAVGQLYNEFDDATVRSLLIPADGTTQDQLRILKRVADNAKLFFANQDRAREIISDELGEG